jgi:hypothetical protein
VDQGATRFGRHVHEVLEHTWTTTQRSVAIPQLAQVLWVVAALVILTARVAHGDRHQCDNLPSFVEFCASQSSHRSDMQLFASWLRLSGACNWLLAQGFPFRSQSMQRLATISSMPTIATLANATHRYHMAHTFTHTHSRLRAHIHYAAVHTTIACNVSLCSPEAPRYLGGESASLVLFLGELLYFGHLPVLYILPIHTRTEPNQARGTYVGRRSCSIVRASIV